ncbi:TetR/AcrR family transcriptional regulator [Chryseolinea lacunae]|uniref:TetR/AcrR family transcriptional regulator n=1 Tax=Chryseolinea lacunae TaxID=2801331 RepID=A0ABS1KNC1_9BACT|nr:TetR/AcrR family transcriptional regulator [Chryseolinea lacunae]MBL0740950.1 TetR/AcrR family transcriptional regulator [Chryseolinea lacunae]
MRDPEATRDKILKKSGILFNTKGYKATSISEITDATGFTKGAIYRHFKSKEELEKESLFQLSTIMMEELRRRIKEELTATDKLLAVLRYFESYISKPVVKGGCPLMNAAIEADDAHPVLRKTALKILDILHQSLVTILDNGIRYKQLKPDLDKDHFATVVIASLEGAIMMSKLRNNNVDIRRVMKHLENQLNDLRL